MAQLTELDEKIGEVYGLAQAAQNATDKVSKLVEDDQIVNVLRQMHDEAAETEQRCEQLAGELDGKKTAIQEKARETKQEAEQMMKDYLGDDADGLDGLEFLVMAEAGELGHVEIAGTLSQRSTGEGVNDVRELLDWAQPIQERHFSQTREAALKLAQQEDPDEVE
jgi:small-conductance mechanosensitive channel